MSGRDSFGPTYRLQCNGVGFVRAAEMVPDLDALGIGTLYLSPVTRAATGSTHGYDVVDPLVLDPALGTEADFELLLATLARHGMNALLDIVPNHMAASPENPYFADVLRHGQESAYASWFDIAWEEQQGRILLPVLDQSLADALAAGSLRVHDDPGGPVLAYGDLQLPLAPGSSHLPGPADPALLDTQHYVLADWRTANAAVNYRRFFDINGLIGVRQEDPDVFTATHELIGSLVADPRVAGVRVDHVDGLRDPAGYLDALRALVGPERVILVEKILDAAEQLPASWPVDGTTGYEFAATVLGGFVDGGGAAAIAAEERGASGDARRFDQRAVDAKRAVLGTLFEHQVQQVLAAGVSELLAADAAADSTAAIVEISAQLEVYRTYRRPGDPVTIDDQRRIEAAAAAARPNLSPGARDVLDRLLAWFVGDLTTDRHRAEFVARWQQLTSPATAKGVEDTALYDAGGLLAAADVGSDPATSLDCRAVHGILADRVRTPRSLSALSTHDSKRSMDVRARLAVLSEIPHRWAEVVAQLDHAAPGDLSDAAARRYLYQTIVGAWPADDVVDERFLERVQEHMRKAAREAKRHTSWVSPDETYEAALAGHVAALLADSERVSVISDLVSDIACAGVTNALSAVVVRALAPGVPDLYQGDDGWLFALTDPDNRVAVDTAAHRASLASLPDVAAVDLVENWRDGRLKQLVVRNCLRWWRTNLGAGGIWDYQPVDVRGPGAGSVFAFARRAATSVTLAVVPLRPFTAVGPRRFAVGECWSGTEIDASGLLGHELTDVLTGARREPSAGWLPLAAVLSTLPVAVLDASAGEDGRDADDHGEDEAPPQHVGHES